MKWWGYLHINGNIQVKPYHDHRDIEDAFESDFVARTFMPFEIENGGDTRQKAIDHIRDKINKTS